MTYATEFPNYPASSIPSLGDGWQDRSWRNEPCPCFIHEATGIVLWAGYPDSRETDDCAQYMVQRCTNRDAVAGWHFDGSPFDLFETDDKATLERSLPHFIAHSICVKWVSRLGLGFHPDTRGADYVPAMSADDVAEYEADIAALFAASSDPYECGIKAMNDAGLIL